MSLLISLEGLLLMMTERFPQGRGGFTLVELVVVLTILGIVLLLALPNLLSIHARRELEGSAERAAVLLRKARYDAIRDGRAVTVALDAGQQSLFIDRDGDLALDAVERGGGVVRLPRGVSPGGPSADADAVAGFTALPGGRAAVFEPNGSLRGDGGAFRIHDTRQNHLEVRVAHPATAAVELRFWQDGSWVGRGEGAERWRWNP